MVLDLATRESLALALAQVNECSYCLSAHSYIGERSAHLSTGAIAAVRKGIAADTKTAAILQFAVAVNDKRGAIPSADIDAARAAGVSDAELAETVAHVALNVLTNYFNKAFDVDIDFPVVGV